MNDDPNTSAAIIILPYGNVRPLMNNNQSTRECAPSRRRTSSRTDFTTRSVMMILCVMSTHDCSADGAHRSVRHPSGNWVVTTRTRLRFIILVVFYYRFFTVGIKKKNVDIYRYIEASTKIINNPSRGVVSRCLLYIYICIHVLSTTILF